MMTSLTACIWRSQEWLVPMRTLLLEAEHTEVGCPSWMAQLCSYWGEFHKQKNQCIEVRHESLQTETGLQCYADVNKRWG